MNFKRLVTAATFLFPGLVEAAVYGDLTPSAFGSIRVSIDDSAVDGCWTNLGEASRYAEDKLQNLGYTISEEPNGPFLISVISARMPNGKCYGSIEIQVYRPANYRGLFGFHESAESSYIFNNYDNSNTLVLNNIKSLIDEMGERQIEALNSY